MKTLSFFFRVSFVRLALLLSTALLPFTVRAQLADFTLAVNITDETCAGNGTMTFSVNNTTPGSRVEYNVYLHPDLTTPVVSTTNTFVDGRAAGHYTVIALQTLGSESNTATAEFDINFSEGPPLDYTIIKESENCSAGNRITIVTTNGTATLYEIISGPVTAAPQTSNVFTGLVDGIYLIRVYDLCNQGISRTYTAEFDPDPPVFSAPVVQEQLTGNCNSVTLENTMSYPPGTIISYPITVTYTIHPSDGSPDIVSTQVFNDGQPALATFSHTFNAPPGVTYTYTINIVNTCGNTFTTSAATFNPVPQVSLTRQDIPCGEFYLNLNASGYHPPYTINFSAPPAGFDPVRFNAGYPGPFTVPTVPFGGNVQPVPEGTYTVTITDDCNRTSEPFTLKLEHEEIVPVAAGFNDGCFANTGRIIVSVPKRKIVSAIITVAPAGYVPALPHNVSSMINSAGILVVNNVPLGDYVITITDECGAVYPNVAVNVPAFTPKGFEANALADCTIGVGSVTVSSGNGKLATMSLVAAPSGYSGVLPQDVSARIDATSGKLFMDGLPQGDYTFSGTDICGVSGQVNVTITGYTPSAGLSFTYVAQCNSFDIDLRDTDTSAAIPTYWLQKQNPDVPGEWGHPETGIAYTEGSQPNDTNAVALLNDAVNYNFHYFGVFRVLKVFTSVGAGQAAKICAIPMDDTFEYYYDVTINNAYKLGCSNNPNDVYIDATGLAPLHYFIVDQVTDAVVFDNGNNPIFSNLAPGVYKFKVENTCREFKTLVRDISMLPDLVDSGTPSNLPFCVQPADSLYKEIDLRQQDASILNGASPRVYSITYFLTATDAEANSNAIDDPEHFVNTSNPQTIYVRMEHMLINVCHDIQSFLVEVGHRPSLNVAQQQFLCEEEGSLTLTAGSGFDGYLWLPGEKLQKVLRLLNRELIH
ncbi:hypothetical protein [Flavobacterium psychrotrophum]|uniref:hypothetical protein n=1 Tax=Flavobacterium psychrotrophum TaxID=2294119 RepID=UPI0013C4B371|nr:hypothetical protein [Flavobacterium psychrotrophum]